MTRPIYLHSSWNLKLINERRRGRDGKVLSLETAKMLCKLEGIVEMQEAILDALKDYSQKKLDVSQDNILVTFAKKELLKELVNVIRDVKPKEIVS